MSTTTIPTLDDAKQAVIKVLTAEPGTLRVMNADVITTEFIFGPDVIVQDEDVPDNQVYEAFDAAIEALIADGLIETAEVFGLPACHLSGAGIERYGI